MRVSIMFFFDLISLILAVKYIHHFHIAKQFFFVVRLFIYPAYYATVPIENLWGQLLKKKKNWLNITMTIKNLFLKCHFSCFSLLQGSHWVISLNLLLMTWFVSSFFLLLVQKNKVIEMFLFLFHLFKESNFVKKKLPNACIYKCVANLTKTRCL